MKSNIQQIYVALLSAHKGLINDRIPVWCQGCGEDMTPEEFLRHLLNEDCEGFKWW